MAGQAPPMAGQAPTTSGWITDYNECIHRLLEQVGQGRPVQPSTHPRHHRKWIGRFRRPRGATMQECGQWGTGTPPLDVTKMVEIHEKSTFLAPGLRL